MASPGIGCHVAVAPRVEVMTYDERRM